MLHAALGIFFNFFNCFYQLQRLRNQLFNRHWHCCWISRKKLQVLGGYSKILSPIGFTGIFARCFRPKLVTTNMHLTHCVTQSAFRSITNPRAKDSLLAKYSHYVHQQSLSVVWTWVGNGNEECVKSFIQWKELAAYSSKCTQFSSQFVHILTFCLGPLHCIQTHKIPLSISG